MSLGEVEWSREMLCVQNYISHCLCDYERAKAMPGARGGRLTGHKANTEGFRRTHDECEC